MIDSTILLINVYMPTDFWTSLPNVEFISCLSEIEAFIDLQSFDFLIIGGDFMLISLVRLITLYLSVTLCLL